MSSPPRTRLTLERVLGVTSLSNAMLAVNPATGEIAYAAGCIVVIYNLRRNKQVRYYRVEKAVACLCFSPSGQYLAIGEKGHLPAITIWDGADGMLCAELQLHKYGVACMAFSRDGTYLLSAGLVHDQHLYAWDLSRDAATGMMRGKAVGVAIVQEKVLAMEYCHEGNFFVTVGEKHFKYWFLDADNNFLSTGYEVNNLQEIQGRSAIMATKEDVTFTSVGCGYGPNKLKTFAITADGTLCSFGVSCVMERLVSLETNHGNALSVSEAYIAVGGSSSVVRLFDPSTLEYKATLPFPPAFGKAHEPFEPAVDPQGLLPEPPHRFPATIGLRLTGSHLVTLYSDRSLFIYDIADPQSPNIDRSFLFHSGGIRDLKIAGRLRGVNAKGMLVYSGNGSHQARNAKSDAVIPHGAFITCSDDNTIRFWHLDMHKPTKTSRFTADNPGEVLDYHESEPWKNPYSQEMLEIIYHDDRSVFGDREAVVLGGTCSCDDLSDVHTPTEDLGPVNGLRGVALHPNLSAFAAGDKHGNVILRSLPLAETVSTEIGAYSSEIHCVAFGQISSSVGSKLLIAAGGRDRLVHIHDSSRDFASALKLENHSGAVTSIQFTSDGKKLISCGADKNVVFSEVSTDGVVTRYNSVPFSGGKVFDIALTSDDEYLLAASNNRLDVLSVSTGKHVRTLHVGEQHRIDICPANFCVAMSGSVADKTIHVIDLQSGETLADGTGHGEAITGITFTPDCRRLVSASSDGCIFVWRIAEELQAAIKARLPKVLDSITTPPPAPPAGPPPQRSEHQEVPPASQLMPPPAPPIAQAKKAVMSNKIPHPVVASKKNQGSSRQEDAKLEGDVPAADSKNSVPRGWKAKAKAAPGPLANVPMEEWMRTRESAKKTFDSMLGDTEGYVQGDLQIDRTKTPDWAKTFQVSKVGAPAKTSPEKQSDKQKSKWSERGAGSLENIIDRPNTAQTESDTPDGLLDLSIANMDVSQSSLATGTSLAIEREQLEKRKKQVETAKAVTDMNDRLVKLGLLKPQKDRQMLSPTSSTADDESMSVKTSDNKAEKAPTTSIPPEQAPKATAENLLEGIPPEMFESIDLPISTRTKSHESPTSRRTMRTSVDLHVDQSMSTFTNGFAVVTESSTDATSKLAVDQSLSSFSDGYKVSGPQRKSAPSLIKDNQVNLSRVGVDASLSEFTDGFKIALQTASPASTVRQSLDVTASMSAFTSGYADSEATLAPTANKSTDVLSVTESLSTFTSGYGSASEEVATAQSLSSFTSGFTAPVKVSPVRRSISNLAVNESLSAFTTGYAGTEAVAQPEVTASLSSFTSGYSDSMPVDKLADPGKPEPADPQKSRTDVERKAAILSSISNLDQQLMLTAQALKTVTNDLDSDPEIEEIRSLMAKLGLAIQRFASKR